MGVCLNASRCSEWIAILNGEREKKSITAAIEIRYL